MNEEKVELKEEALLEKIKEILNCVNTTSDPESLEEIRTLIKKNVPFGRRGYFSAYLLKLVVSNNGKAEIKNKKESYPKKEFTKEKAENVSTEKREERKERVIPEDAKTLYLNIGKMKNLYAKDLSKLLQNELGIAREDIYILRVHDKYSFITMSETNCNKAIETLNGKEINGRVAQLNFSQNKF